MQACYVSLILVGTKITAFGAMMIFKGIDISGSVKCLSLAYNAIGSNSSFELQGMDLSNLRHLDLSYNRMPLDV